MAPTARRAPRFSATSPFRADPPAEPAFRYAVADRVHHDRHGLGEVVSVEAGPFVTARFGTGLIRVANDQRLCKI